MIYKSFKISVLDQITGSFNRSEILALLSKKMRKFKHRQDGNIVMLKIRNLDDINERYSLESSDLLLKKLVEKLELFLEKNISKEILIGRYSNEYFLMFCSGKSSQLLHFLNVFEKSILADGIDDIELKIKFELVNINYSDSLDKSISILTEKLSSEENAKFAITDEFESSVCKSILDRNFTFQTQLVRSLKESENLKSVLVKIYTEDFALVSKQKAQNIANKNGYEVLFDINSIKKFIEFNTQDKQACIIEVSAVSLRNLQFIKFIKDFVDQGKINPQNIIFEFSEKLVYDEINRFKEILNDYKNLGFRFALNKFGGNNAGFEYLKYLPIDFIIYDIEFNKNLDDEKFKNIFKNLNDTAEDLGIKSIIRFVDKAEFFDLIKLYKTDYAQGFYIEKPKEI
ncbi:EAL domain-containing protein [Campylobacter sp.]|uniref:EAL domain-containing protein n=1 Tax=Campylobacter sp. TaxID=205 RepID=UPI002708843E|nr:EAL domain-containing protein [Campylobacter sp.]